jgi:hypothetical protein
MADTFASFAKRLDKFVDGLSGAELRKVMTDVGVAAKKDAASAASADLGGDPKFSGWAPTLDTRFDHVGEGRVSFHPSKRAAGPWTVAQSGRNPKRGKRRYNGRTQGKGTADDALRVIERESPKRIEDAVKRAIRKSFD